MSRKVEIKASVALLTLGHFFIAAPVYMLPNLVFVLYCMLR